jgi:hypothetical protein
MPVMRYFVFVGGTLLALLFMIDASAPKQAVVSSAEAVVNTDIPFLRIRSDRKWPERIVFDTSVPTIVPPPVAVAQSIPAPPTAVSEYSPKARVRESFAQFVPQPAKPESKPQHKRKVIARSHATQPTVLAAQEPRFGFFGSSFR